MLPLHVISKLMQLGIDQWCAFGIGVSIGIESLRLTVAFHSLTGGTISRAAWKRDELPAVDIGQVYVVYTT